MREKKMLESVIFDTEALLAFYLGEPDGKEVERRLLRLMRRGK